MKKSIFILKIVLILSLTSILILWSVILLTSNSIIWFLIQKQNLSLSEEEVKAYNNQVVSFFKGDAQELDFLTEDEFSHMKDVKNIVVKTNFSFWISLILFLPTFLFIRKSIKLILRRVSIGVASFLILLLILSFTNFSWIFLKFHETFFVSNYSFASNSMLKILYPDSFFRNVFICYFLLSIVGCLAVIATSYKLKK